MNNQFRITPEAMRDKTSWPIWLQVAWETEPGQIGSFEPAPGGNGIYVARGRQSGTTQLGIGDIVTPEDLS